MPILMSGESILSDAFRTPADVKKEMRIYGMLLGVDPRSCDMTHCLPKREENDQLDAKDLEERLVFRKIFFELQVKLDQAKHGHGDRSTFEAHYPYVRERRVERRFAVPIEYL